MWSGAAPGTRTATVKKLQSTNSTTQGSSGVFSSRVLPILRSKTPPKSASPKAVKQRYRAQRAKKFLWSRVDDGDQEHDAGNCEHFASANGLDYCARAATDARGRSPRCGAVVSSSKSLDAKTPHLRSNQRVNDSKASCGVSSVDSVSAWNRLQPTCHAHAVLAAMARCGTRHAVLG